MLRIWSPTPTNLFCTPHPDFEWLIIINTMRLWPNVRHFKSLTPVVMDSVLMPYTGTLFPLLVFWCYILWRIVEQIIDLLMTWEAVKLLWCHSIALIVHSRYRFWHSCITNNKQTPLSINHTFHSCIHLMSSLDKQTWYEEHLGHRTVCSSHLYGFRLLLRYNNDMVQWVNDKTDVCLYQCTYSHYGVITCKYPTNYCSLCHGNPAVIKSYYRGKSRAVARFSLSINYQRSFIVKWQLNVRN